jgi:Replication-relaxation
MTLATIPARRPSRSELQLASRGHSRRGANPLTSSSWPISSPGLSPLSSSSTRTIRTVELQPADALSTSTSDYTPTPRDMAMLMALDSYRYLDRGQLQALFFSGPRSCQYRLRWLVDHGLVRTWRVVMRPGRVCRSSIYLLSRRGAAALAEWLDEDPQQYLRRAEHALERRFHLVHQLEANQFFVELAFAARDLPGHGLYHWVGEHGVQDAYAEGDERGPIPDGWGRLLAPDREVLIHLEWDRGTEQPRRLRAKLHAYTAYFADRAGASANQVLFVAPTEQRERQIACLLPDHADAERESCRFWTTATAFMAAGGPLGAVWGGDGSRRRVSVLEMASLPRSERQVEDAVGKPGWWLRRPGGGGGS